MVAMSSLNISTRQLRAFVALSELKNFTRAAEQCGLSQPAFSAVIQGVEAAAGARLFDRSTRHVELTSEGRLLEQWARRLLTDFEAAFTILQDHVTLRTGRVGVSALPTIAATILPAVLSRYHAAHPGVAIELFDTLSDVSLELVRQGRADLAVTASGMGNADFVAETLFEERFHLVCLKGDPLLERASLKLADLAGRPFIHMVRSSSIRQQLNAAPGAAGLSSTMEVTHLATVAGMIESSLGISVLPEFAIPRLASENLVVHPLDEPDLYRTIYLVRSSERSLSMAAQAMHDLLLAEVGGQARDRPAAARRSRKAG
jgi:DNA-binding transcriptional LysR family regulator